MPHRAQHAPSYQSQSRSYRPRHAPRACMPAPMRASARPSACIIVMYYAPANSSICAIRPVSAMPPVPSSVSPALTDCCRACETCIVRPAPMYGSVSAIHVCVPRYECLPCPTTFQACLTVRPLIVIRAPQTPWGSGCAGRAPRHTTAPPYTKLSNSDGTACCGRT